MGGKVEVRPGVVALRSIGHSAQESEGGGVKCCHKLGHCQVVYILLT
jgi:hypothetical protein